MINYLQRLKTIGVFVICVFFLHAADAATVKSVRLAPNGNHSRLVFDVNQPVSHKVFQLKNPRRLVIDIPNARYHGNVSRINLRGSPVSAIRSAKYKKYNMRFVLDLTSAVKPRSFMLAKTAKHGPRLVVDLHRDKAVVKTVRELASSNGRRDIVIAIDAGHGGKDPGSLGPTGILEKDVVLAISKQLKYLLTKKAGFKAVMIREGDTFVKLRNRTKIAHKYRADLFVSIHADAFHKKSARGASVYALSKRGASSETGRYLARRQNDTSLIGGVGSVSLKDKDKTLASVLLDLSMTATMSSSTDVGGEMVKSLSKVTKLHKRGVEKAGFVVLKSPDIPSILVETGFISNPTEERNLSSKAYQRKMANAIYKGIVRYFTRVPPAGTLLAAQRKNVSQKLSDQEHVIAYGDTISEIAQRYNVSVKRLLEHNGLKKTRIVVGQRLKIPSS